LFVCTDFTGHYIAGIRFRKQKEKTGDFPREAYPFKSPAGISRDLEKTNDAQGQGRRKF